MEEQRARRVVNALRALGVAAQQKKAGVYQFGVVITLPGGREAIWDIDGTAGLEAQVMANGMLVGYVPSIAGSEDFDEAQVIEAIAHTDYDKPIGRRSVTPLVKAEPLPLQGGLFRRFVDGFRDR